MANTIYSKFIIEDKVADLLDTKLSVSPFYTLDTSLTESEGMVKKIHTYTATGDVADVEKGAGNTTSDDVEVSFTEKEYTVKFTQGRFPYFDEEAITDAMLVDVGLQKMSANMVNDLTSKFYAELGKATKTSTYDASGITFANVVDAIALFGENEDGLFMLINPSQKAQLRKNLKDELKYVEGFVRTGYIGSICNVPIYTSREVAADTAFIATKEAVTVFTKKEVESETERDANLRKNTIYARRCNVVALTDANKVVKMTKATA